VRQVCGCFGGRVYYIILLWLATQMKVMNWETAERVMMRVCMLVARGRMEWTLEIMVRVNRESETIRKVFAGEEGRNKMASRHWKMA